VQQEEQAKKKDLGRCFNDEGDVMEEKERKRAEKSALEVFAEQLRRKELKTIDHASQDYLKIRKNFQGRGDSAIGSDALSVSLAYPSPKNSALRLNFSTLPQGEGGIDKRGCE